MRTTIAPSTIMPVINMVPVNGSDGTPSYAPGSPAGQTQFTTTTNSVVTADGTLGTITAGKKALIQNLDDAAVYVKLGTGASASDFTFMLAAGSAANNGTGGSYMVDDFVGTVSILAAAGSPRVNFSLFS